MAIFLVNLNEIASYDIMTYLYEEYKQNWSGLYKRNCILICNTADMRNPTDQGSKPQTLNMGLVEDFCKNKGIEFHKMDIRADMKGVKQVIESFMIRFCKPNYTALHNEKKNLEVDDGDLCTLI